jgi:hypothetical protein
MNIFPTAIREFLRHTGAGSFVRSSAVSYDCTVFGYFIEMFRELIGGNAQSVRQFLIRFSPRRRVPRVKKRELFATIQPLSHFIGSNSCCFHPLPPPLSQVFTRIICAFWWSFVAKR